MSFNINGDGMVSALRYGGIATAAGGAILGPMLLTQLGNESNSKVERAADATAGLISLGTAAAGVAMAYTGFKHSKQVKTFYDALGAHSQVLDDAKLGGGKIDGNKYLAGAKTFIQKMSNIVENAPHVARV